MTPRTTASPLPVEGSSHPSVWEGWQVGPGRGEVTPGLVHRTYTVFTWELRQWNVKSIWGRTMSNKSVILHGWNSKQKLCLLLRNYARPSGTSMLTSMLVAKRSAIVSAEGNLRNPNAIVNAEIDGLGVGEGEGRVERRTWPLGLLDQLLRYHARGIGGPAEWLIFFKNL